MKWKPYPSYKPSGVESLGAQPAHWEVRPLMRLIDTDRPIMYGIVLPGPDVDDGIPIVKGGDIKPGRLALDRLCRTTFEIEASYARSRLKGGDIVFSIRGTVGETELVPDEIAGANLTQDAARVAPRRDVDARWLIFVLKARGVTEPLLSLSLGAAVRGVNIRDLKRLRVPVPPAREQRAIAHFLQAATARLDALVAKKRALVERLREKRTALISRTVTRGLPPEAARAAGLAPHPKLKPSGIPWLADIPEHWSAVPLRRAALVLDCKHRTVEFVDDGVPVASIREVHRFEVDLSAAKMTTEEEHRDLCEGGRRPLVGDIIYSRNATVGDAALVATTERFSMGQDVCLLRPLGHVSRFLVHALRSQPVREQVESLMIGSTFRRINVSQINAFLVPLPPVPEQQAIAEYLDRETARIDRLVEKVEAAIERLQEYRQALITAAVTGKIDVREKAPGPAAA